MASLREVGAQRDLASALGNLGHACLHLDDIERAQALFGESMAAHRAEHNKPGMAECLIGFAATAVVCGVPGAGARLLAASAAISGQPATDVWPATQTEYDRYLALARAGLSEAAFQEEEAIGSAMSLEQAIEYALHLPLKPGSPSTVRSEPGDLTEREREVAVLIAAGRSNGEIAAELVLSKRTVEKHISSIFSKLELTHRGQIVQWAIEHRLTRGAA